MISLDTTSLVKTIIALGLSAVVMLVWYGQRRLMPVLDANERTTRWLAFVALRLVPFAAVYLVLDQEPRSDVIFFYERAVPAMEGKLVYRDFLSFHAPLFTYLTVLPLFIWNNARVLVLMMALIEFVIANATYRYVRPTTPDALLRYVLYYLLPLPFVAMVLSSEEDVWMWGFGLLTLALPASLSDRRFAFLTGLIWGVAMLTIKFMLVVLLIPLFFLIKDRLYYLLGLAVIGIPSILILYALMGTAFLMPIQHSSYPMAPNLVSVLRPILGSLFGQVSLTSLNWVGLLGTIGGGSWVAWQFRHLGYRRAFPLVFCFVFGLFMVMLPSAPGYYLFTQEMALVFVLLANTRTHWFRFAVLNFLLVVQPILMIVYADNALYTSLAMLGNPVYLLDYGIQVVELAGLIWLVVLSYNKLKVEQGTGRMVQGG
ncbi:hypothetical protein [Rudanella lutea]|uniref:hypothetical protein n=1 Tax=Rudanella lutea TaxID=451374 RepID=UPI00036C2718|nr:hypothetical protein [Rudanella lutea]